jgi:hypothetical protein
MKKFFIFVAFLLPISSISGAILTSNGTGGGNWTDANSWDGANTPADMASGDTLVIQAGDLITLSSLENFNGVIQIYGDFYLDNGKLFMDAASIIKLEAGSSISAEGTGQNEQITIGSNKITSSQINEIVPPDELTEESLPVKVIYFKALELPGSIKLEWGTTFEENFDYFTLERSFDGRIFSDHVKIFSKTASSSAIKKYQYIDEMPFPGLSYYRLKATDFDGSVEYHGIVSANLEDLEHDILIYANPATHNQITVSYNGNHESSYKVLNITGQVIEKGILIPGLNDIRISPTISNSIYFFQVEGMNATIIKKFVIR